MYIIRVNVLNVKIYFLEDKGEKEFKKRTRLNLSA